ncbi:MAG: metal-dependent transcriptional regulator [Lewinellaceae bacterium]|nr:metal-dependent transcriptional regulator [Lewinellaceae bacterium]
MEHISHTEENYLKAIFKISEDSNTTAGTNSIAQQLNTSAASVTDMIKRLSEKGLIHYERYRGVTLTDEGLRLATHLVRKHRLWEVFLVEKLGFSWDEVHDIAEQLEHIKSLELVERLDEYLAHPKFDPHGDPIPDAQGNFTFRKQIPLAELSAGDHGVIVGVQDHAPAFLQYLDRLTLTLGTELQVLERHDYDQSMQVRLNGTQELTLSQKVCMHLFVQKR